MNDQAVPADRPAWWRRIYDFLEQGRQIAWLEGDLLKLEEPTVARWWGWLGCRRWPHYYISTTAFEAPNPFCMYCGHHDASGKTIAIEGDSETLAKFAEEILDPLGKSLGVDEDGYYITDED